VGTPADPAGGLMFRDNSLIPSEAIRLAALGFLAEGPRRYGELAASIRHFTSCVAGPSLELMGTSLELLRYEGLTTAEGDGESAALTLTEAGRAMLGTLLMARLRAPLGEFNRLSLLLKLRFLHLLDEEERREQIALIADSIESELIRLKDLRRTQGSMPAAFLEWLDHDIAALEARRLSLAAPA
jgi:DNA-binding PadR family transcriptional regulator